MAYRIDLFDSSGARVAIIQEEIISSLSLDTAIDSAPTLTLSIPLSEEKSTYISPAYRLKIWNTTTAAYEHSVFTLCDPDIEDSGGALKITATYQGILTRLSNEDIEAYDTGSAGDTFTNVITALLAYQLNTPAITLGTIEPVQTVALAVENTTIYSALNAVRDAFGGWFEVDADYKLNWYNDNTNTPDREIRRSKNLKSLTYTPSYTQIVNRVYAYGKGESDARLSLGDVLHFTFAGGGTFGGPGFTIGETLDTSFDTIHCVVLDYAVTSGTWVGGDAAGWILAGPPSEGWDADWPTGVYFDGSVSGANVAYSVSILKQRDVEYIEDTTSQTTYGIMAKRYVDKRITHPFTLYKYAQRILAQYKTPPYQYSVDMVNLAEIRDYDYSLESLGLDTRVRVIDDLLSVDVNTSIVSMSIDLLSPADITIELSTVKTDLSDIFNDIISTQNINQSVATQISAGQVTVLGTFVVADWASAGVTTIDGDKITTNTIAANTLTTSTMTARTITLSGADSILQGNYTAGSAGWQIKGDGNAEFNNVTIRGTLEACTVGTGQTLSILGDITLSGSADMRIIGSNGTISFYDNASDYYPKILIYNVGTPTISMRNSGSVSTEEMQLTSNYMTYYYGSSYGILLDREYCTISVGDNSATNSGIKLKGLDGSIYCVSINASDSGDGTVRMNSTVLLNTNTLYFGDTSHYLYSSGSTLYWFDGSSSYQIN